MVVCLQTRSFDVVAGSFARLNIELPVLVRPVRAGPHKAYGRAVPFGPRIRLTAFGYAPREQHPGSQHSNLMFCVVMTRWAACLSSIKTYHGCMSTTVECPFPVSPHGFVRNATSSVAELTGLMSMLWSSLPESCWLPQSWAKWTFQTPSRRGASGSSARARRRMAACWYFMAV